MKPTQRIPNSGTVSYYCIAFLDILGQKDEILSLSDLPLPQEDKTNTIHVLRSTVGTVLLLRKAFRDIFAEFDKDSGRFDSLPPEQRAEAIKIRHNEAKIRGVSDSIIITVPIIHDGEFASSVISIYRSFCAICVMFMLTLTVGKSLRGGVDIGWGIPLPDTPEEVYGSALVKAYSLENKTAKYPRVVVGDRLLKYLEDMKALSPDNGNRGAAIMYADKCSKLITTDYDYQNTVDIIGEEMRSTEGAVTSEMVEKGYKYVVETHKRLVIAGDRKLSSRYGSLRSYLESRLHLWNIQPYI